MYHLYLKYHLILVLRCRLKKTKKLLEKANALIAGDREKDYGDKVHNHNNISKNNDC